MRSVTLIKAFILLITAGVTTEVYADVAAELLLRTSIPQAASIMARTSSISNTKVVPETGVLTGDLAAVFELDANDTDGGYDFVMTSTVQTSGSAVSGYDSEGNLLFTNTENLPSESDVDEARSHSGNNSNVIVYPVNITTTSPLTSDFNAEHATYGNCYMVKINGGTNGTITHTVTPTPVAGTFHKTKDTSGTYQAVITLTAVGK